MTLNAIQSYVKGLLDGLPMPFPQQGTLSVYINPPNPTDEPTPQAYVWGSVGHEERKAGPRAKFGQIGTGGLKHNHWSIDIWVYYAEQSDDPDADSLFPAVIDSICAVLRNTPMPVTATDPTTQAQTNVLKVGEYIRIDQSGVRSIADQRFIQCECRITVDVVESYQG